MNDEKENCYLSSCIKKNKREYIIHRVYINNILVSSHIVLKNKAFFVIKSFLNPEKCKEASFQ